MFKALFRLLGGSSVLELAADRSVARAAAPSQPSQFEVGTRGVGYEAVRFPANRPPGGPWRVRYERVEVAGVHYRSEAVHDFAHEVSASADANSPPFYLDLEREPTNPNDSNAIRVLGVTPKHPDGTFLGYVPRELAAELAGVEPIGAEAERFYASGKFTELTIHILERKPTKQEEAQQVADVDVSTVRIDPQSHPASLIEMAKQLKRVGRRDDAATLLERVVEAHQGNDEWHAAVMPLTAIYRQRKEWEKELVLLELLFSHEVPRGRRYEQLRDRLEEARQNTAS